MRLGLAAFVLFALGVQQARAQLDQLEGLNGLTDIPKSELSQQDTNPLSLIALGLHPDDWKHAEGEHFIYHYVRNFVASRLAVEAEFNFRVVGKELQKEAPADGRKSHIYIFDRSEDWEEFQKAGELERWTGGIHSAGSLFVLRDPANKFSGNSLGHEIAHLLVFRSYGYRIPSWLNEGFAEYVSRNSRASYQRARHYLAKPRSYSLAPAEVIPVAELVSFSRPPNDRVDAFYDESERLVRFLAQADKGRFLAFLEATAKGEAFEPALLRSYAGVFASREDFETKFRAYVSQDFGSTLQDQE